MTYIKASPGLGQYQAPAYPQAQPATSQAAYAQQYAQWRKAKAAYAAQKAAWDAQQQAAAQQQTGIYNPDDQWQTASRAAFDSADAGPVDQYTQAARDAFEAAGADSYDTGTPPGGIGVGAGEDQSLGDYMNPATWPVWAQLGAAAGVGLGAWLVWSRYLRKPSVA